LNVKVQVKLFAHLRQYAPGDEATFELELDPGTTVAELIKTLGIPPKVNRVFWVNGLHAEADTKLGDGDTVFIHPPASGG
jgi:molybdopterin synthase sulfur carrier subunit